MMIEPSIEDVAYELNARSSSYNVGNLQTLRKRILGLKRKASSQLFAGDSIQKEYAFHYGGRTELQFNIGDEWEGGRRLMRFGVAFSLEPSRSLPDPSVLLGKISLFNDYIELYPERFLGLRMWHYTGERSDDYVVSVIPPELAEVKSFIFVGLKQPADSIDYAVALTVFDSLLPLYLYTLSIGKNTVDKISGNSGWEFRFVPGVSERSSSTTASYAAQKIDISLRHNELQYALVKKLIRKYGYDNVGVEVASGIDNSVDLVVKINGNYWFYEIKTAHTAKACIRQALGQLIEYSYWPKNKNAERLIIVGEPNADTEAEKYLEILRSKFSLPISYESIKPWI